MGCTDFWTAGERRFHIPFCACIHCDCVLIDIFAGRERRGVVLRTRFQTQRVWPLVIYEKNAEPLHKQFKIGSKSEEENETPAFPSSKLGENSKRTNNPLKRSNNKTNNQIPPLSFKKKSNFRVLKKKDLSHFRAFQEVMKMVPIAKPLLGYYQRVFTAGGGETTTINDVLLSLTGQGASGRKGEGECDRNVQTWKIECKKRNNIHITKRLL